MKPPNRKSWKGALYSAIFDAAAAKVDPLTDQLGHSRMMRELIAARFQGQLPTSIWPFRPTSNYADPLAAGKNTLNDSSAEGGDLYGNQKALGGRLSTFEAALARDLITLYSNPGDLVLDPFAGRAARLQACLDLDRRYFGFDASPDAVACCDKVVEERGAHDRATVLQCSSLLLGDELEKNSADCVLTCPPYGWSEFYGNNGDGIEAAPSYADLVDELAACLLLASEALKPERYLICVVRGWHAKGTFYDVAAHLERYLSAAGLTFHEHAVHKMSTSRERFHSDIAIWRRTAQVHQDVLVWCKQRPSGAVPPYHSKTIKENTARLKQESELRASREAVIRRLTGREPEVLRPLTPAYRP